MPLRPSAPIGPATPLTLAVITWNMHAGVGDLPRLVADLAEGRLTPAPPESYVLLLQEAVTGLPSDPARLVQDRRLSMVYEPVHTAGTRSTGNAIVSTQPITGTHAVALPQARQPRIALTASISVANVPFFLVNAHLENRGRFLKDLLFSDAARGRQASALVAQLPDGPGIAGGDLNTWLGPSEPAWRIFAERFPDTPAEPTDPTFRDRLVLDHLFFDVPDGWLVEWRVLPEGYGSDHLPVLAIVRAP